MLCIHLSILHGEPARESLRSSLHCKLLLSYCKQGRRRDALCTSRSGDAEASATTPKRLRQSPKGRITGRISEDPDRPADRCLYEESCILSPSVPHLLPCYPAPPISGFGGGKKSGRPWIRKSEVSSTFFTTCFYAGGTFLNTLRRPWCMSSPRLSGIIYMHIYAYMYAYICIYNVCVCVCVCVCVRVRVCVCVCVCV
jgi:hypothetical protein